MANESKRIDWHIGELVRPCVLDYPASNLTLIALARSLLGNPLHVWTQVHFAELVNKTSTRFGQRIVVSDPDIIREILVSDQKNFPRDRLQQRVLDRVTGESVFAASGDQWAKQRRAMAPAFSPAALAGFEASIQEIAQILVQRICDLPGAAFDVLQLATEFAVQVVNQALLANRLQEPASLLATDIRAFALAQGALRVSDLLHLPGLPFDVFRKPVQSSRRRAARTRLAAPRHQGGHDVVSALASEGSLTERQIEDNISTLIGAGADTTGVALAWALLVAAFKPFVADRLAFGDAEEVRAIIKEILRLFPPAPVFSRVTLQKRRFGNAELDAGAEIIIAPWVLHRHKRLWKEPELFDPSRFQPPSAAVHRFAWLPFGAGPRVCIGQGLAMLELETALPILCRALQFHVVSTLPLQLKQVITLQPLQAVLLKASRR